jgi:hypothetical protein
LAQDIHGHYMPVFIGSAFFVYLNESFSLLPRLYRVKSFSLEAIMREIIDWIDKEVARLDREVKRGIMEGDGQMPVPEFLKESLGDFV